jgi:hypothetical protein
MLKATYIMGSRDGHKLLEKILENLSVSWKWDFHSTFQLCVFKMFLVVNPCYLNAFLESTDHMINSNSIRKHTENYPAETYNLSQYRMEGCLTLRPLHCKIRPFPSVIQTIFKHEKMNTCRQRKIKLVQVLYFC